MTLQDQTIRPTMKTVWAAYALAALVFIAIDTLIYIYVQNLPLWLPFVPLIVYIPALRMHFNRRLVSMRLHDGHLTLESGFLASMRRTIDLAKVQDVTVRQSLPQRLLGVGDLRLETAGESGSIAIRNIDRPREVANAIIAGSVQAQQNRVQIPRDPEAR